MRGRALVGGASLMLLLGIVWWAQTKRAGAPPPPRSGPPDLVLITIDTLRADHLGAYGYFRDTSPSIDRFAADALLFERAVAPMATTLPAHVSLLTSSYPVRHGVLSNFQFMKRPLVTGEGLQTAAQMLARAGYRTAAFTSSSPLRAETGIAAGFQEFRDSASFERTSHHEVLGEVRVDVVAEETVSAAIAWLRGARSPFFLWVHLFDPHDPYSAPPSFGHRYATGPALLGFLEALHFSARSLPRAAPIHNDYDREVRYADREVGRLLDALRERGVYDSAAIVLTADHGEGLLQHDWLRHGVIWNEQSYVPLVLRLPDGPRGERAGLASLIDVLPTLAGAGVPLDRSRLDGIDLLAETRETALTQRTVRSLWPRASFTLTGLEWKYWYYDGEPDRLYHLARDPHETRDVIGEHPAVAARMREQLLALVAIHQARSGLEPAAEISDELREQLRRLGYVE